MPFKVPSLEQVRKLSRDTIVNAVAKGRPVLRRTVEDALGNAVGGLLYLRLERLRVMWSQLWADTATGRWLDRIATIWGLTRKDRGPATGKIQVTGENGSVLPADSTFEFPGTGIVYFTLDEVEISGGEAFVLVTASTGGSDTNLAAGAVISLTVSVAGIDDNATVVTGDDGEDGLVDGVDIEDDEALRARVLARIREPAAGGSIADYVGWALEVSGISRAWCVPGINGPGTVLILVVDDTSDPITPGEAKLAEVLAYLETKAPATDVPGLSVFAPELVPINHEFVLSPNTEAVQAAVLEKLAEFYRLRGIGDTVRLSQIIGAVDSVPGEEWHELVAPAADVPIDEYSIPTLGDVTFEDP